MSYFPSVFEKGNLDTCLNASNCSTANYSSNANNSSTVNGPSVAKDLNSQSSQDFNPASVISTSDCSGLSSPCIPSLISMALISSNIAFNIKCDIDHYDPDAGFMTVTVFTFEDCIAACASFNQVCVSGIKTLPIPTLIGSQGGSGRQNPSPTLRF